ncbi:SHD1 domain-containing protein [Haloferula rosea]|uniref:SHD1 domain-containing protein n=1 Tax=Haloferula rosea TaxID=490093 RepID=UPI0019038310|nr:SHD1 domain-containing protein [Haloferula rosea]
MCVSEVARFLLVTLCLATLEARTWTDTSGREVEGEWVSSDARSITLRLESGKTVTFPLAKLSDEDQSYATKVAAANRHPAGWKPLRVRMEYMEETPRAVGMPGAFHRLDAYTWEADLPPGAWIRVDTSAGAFGGGSHLLQWKGAPEWHFDTEGVFLYRSKGGTSARELVGVSVGSGGGSSALDSEQREKFHKLVAEVGPVESVSSVMLSQIDPVRPLLAKLDPLAVTVQVDHRSDFSKLAGLRRMKAVYFNVGQLQSFDTLGELSSIECLDAGNAFTSTLDDSGVLAKMSRLKFLETGMRSSSSFAGFSRMKGLEAMSVRCSTPASLESLVGLSRLHSIDGFSVPPALVRRLPGLVRVGSRIDSQKDDGSPLVMEKVSFLRFASVEQVVAWKQAGGLPFLHEIEYLNGDLGELEGMSSLRHVGISCYGETSQSGHGGATRLRTLRVKGNAMHARKVWEAQEQLYGLGIEVWTEESSLPGLAGVDGLRWLELSKLPKLKSLKGIGDLGELSYLAIEKMDALTDVSDLSALTGMEALRLEGLPVVEKLSFRGLSSLKDLRLRGLVKLTGVDQVSVARALRRSNINGCPAMVDWDDWGGLASLEDFYLVGRSSETDLASLLKLDSLRQVDLISVKIPDKQRLEANELTGSALLERVEAALR